MLQQHTSQKLLLKLNMKLSSLFQTIDKSFAQPREIGQFCEQSHLCILCVNFVCLLCVLIYEVGLEKLKKSFGKVLKFCFLDSVRTLSMTTAWTVDASATTLASPAQQEWHDLTWTADWFAVLP